MWRGKLGGGIREKLKGWHSNLQLGQLCNNGVLEHISPCSVRQPHCRHHVGTALQRRHCILYFSLLLLLLLHLLLLGVAAADSVLHKQVTLVMEVGTCECVCVCVVCVVRVCVCLSECVCMRV